MNVLPGMCQTTTESAKNNLINPMMHLCSQARAEISCNCAISSLTAALAINRSHE
jgi:hypothetical protein